MFLMTWNGKSPISEVVGKVLGSAEKDFRITATESRRARLSRELNRHPGVRASDRGNAVIVHRRETPKPVILEPIKIEMLAPEPARNGNCNGASNGNCNVNGNGYRNGNGRHYPAVPITAVSLTQPVSGNGLPKPKPYSYRTILHFTPGRRHPFKTFSFDFF